MDFFELPPPLAARSLCMEATDYVKSTLTEEEQEFVCKEVSNAVKFMRRARKLRDKNKVTLEALEFTPNPELQHPIDSNIFDRILDDLDELESRKTSVKDALDMTRSAFFEASRLVIGSSMLFTVHAIRLNETLLYGADKPLNYVEVMEAIDYPILQLSRLLNFT